jgi:hypothetical protein
MKKIITFIGMAISLSSFANLLPDITVEALRAEGRNHYTNQDASACYFSAVVRTYANGEKVLEIYLNSFNPRNNSSDTKGPNFSMDLEPGDFPLKNGIVKRYQEGEISYENGILKKSFKEPSAQYFGLAKDIETIEIAVDPKLQKVKWAKAVKYVKRNLLPNIKDKNLNCEF